MAFLGPAKAQTASQEACAALWSLDRLVVAAAIGAGHDDLEAQRAAKRKIAAAFLDDPGFARLRLLGESDLPLSNDVTVFAQGMERLILEREAAALGQGLGALAQLIDRRDLAASAELLGCRGGERPVVIAKGPPESVTAGSGSLAIPGTAAALAAAAAAVATGSFMGRRRIGYAWRCIEDDKADRAALEQPVTLFFGGAKRQATLIESSRHGGRVVIEPPLTEGTPLVLHLGTKRVPARVRWSTPNGGDLLYLEPFEALNA